MPRCAAFLALLALTGLADDFNEAVLEAARGFDDGGGYEWEGGTGCPRDIEFDGQTILARQERGSYCCGYTFAVVMQVCEAEGLLNGQEVTAVRAFQKQWYGAVEDEETRERQCARALENLGIGKAVKPRKARPGDFLQFWRGRSGHSVVFLGWETRGEAVVGIRYRSSQGSTDGIGDKVELFQGAGGDVDPERMYFGRLTGP